MSNEHSKRCEAKAKQLEEMASDLTQLLGVLIEGDENVRSLIDHHRRDAQIYRSLAAQYRVAEGYETGNSSV
jgi:hypothetical protein